MNAQSDDDGNQWPGYVDALTTMTMMLIFIMVILVVAIFGLSQNVAREYIQRMADAADVELKSDNSNIDELVRAVEKRVKQAKDLAAVVTEAARIVTTPITLTGPAADGPHLLLRSSVPAAGSPQAKTLIAVDPTSAMLRLVFEKRATSIDQKSADAMAAFLKADQRVRDGAILEIKAYAAAEASISDSRRIAFYRLMAVRTRLIEMGIPANRIEARVHDRLPDIITEDVHVFARKAA